MLPCFKESGDDVGSNSSSSLRALSAVVSLILRRDILTPTMATLSMAFLKPAGWFLAYSGILDSLKGCGIDE